jgi:hypothetical protein
VAAAAVEARRSVEAVANTAVCVDGGVVDAADAALRVPPCLIVGLSHRPAATESTVDNDRCRKLRQDPPGGRRKPFPEGTRKRLWAGSPVRARSGIRRETRGRAWGGAHLAGCGGHDDAARGWWYKQSVRRLTGRLSDYRVACWGPKVPPVKLT